MKHFFQLFWRISLLQKGPQDVPAQTLFFLMLFVMLQLTAVALGGLNGKAAHFLLVESVNGIVMALLVWLFLYLRGHATRFNQTMAAIFGVGVLFNLFKIGLRLIHGLDVLPGFLLNEIILLIIFWQITVIGHILGLAMGFHIAVGILVAIFFLFVEWGLGSVLSGVAA